MTNQHHSTQLSGLKAAELLHGPPQGFSATAGSPGGEPPAAPVPSLGLATAQFSILSCFPRRKLIYLPKQEEKKRRLPPRCTAVTPALPVRAWRVPPCTGDVAVALSSSTFPLLAELQECLGLSVSPRFPCAALFLSSSVCRELAGCTPGTARVWGTLRPCNLPSPKGAPT